MAAHHGIIPPRMWCAVCLYIVNILNFPCLTVADPFSVIGPDQPIIVPPGGDAVLSFYLNPRISAENMNIHWLRTKLVDEVIYFYNNSMDSEGEVAEYRGRTEFIKDDISTGNVSLRIRHVKSSDSGTYKCLFSIKNISEVATVELKVAALGSFPFIIYLHGPDRDLVQLVCFSSGWYPQPEVLCNDGRDQNVSTLIEFEAEGDNEQFTVKITYTANIHSDIQLTCHMRNTVTDLQRNCEGAVSVVEDAEKEGTDQSGPPRVHLAAVVSCGALLMLILLVVAAALILRRRKESSGFGRDSQQRTVPAAGTDDHLHYAKINLTKSAATRPVKEDIQYAQVNVRNVAPTAQAEVDIDYAQLQLQKGKQSKTTRLQRNGEEVVYAAFTGGPESDLAELDHQGLDLRSTFYSAVFTPKDPDALT